MRAPNCNHCPVSITCRHNKMINSADLYLGTFLILCGFSLSLLNLRRVVKNNNKFSSVLLSENILLTCIGIAFVSRSLYEFHSSNLNSEDAQTRIAEIRINKEYTNCEFRLVIMSYGPLIVSLVNSFLSLIIDNYMHYSMLQDEREMIEENSVQEVTRENRIERKSFFMLFNIWKKYFSYIAIALQWIVPVVIALSMYPMGLTEKKVFTNNVRSIVDSCMAIVDMGNETCPSFITSDQLELRKYAQLPTNYLEVIEQEQLNSNTTNQIGSVIDNIYKILGSYKNNSVENVDVTSNILSRRPKSNETCMKICYIDNKNLLLYMFILAIISYFVPITISTILLTKIHMMDTAKRNVKTFVSRELFYNILFWTPVMFDTFLSLIFCSYTMNGTRTSMLNIIANIYQTVKNFMNTKYFTENIITPA